MTVKNRSVPTDVGVGITMKGVQPGRIPWWAPVLMLVARPVFALVTQLAVAAGFRLSRHPKPLQEAARWWMVSGTLIDLLSLGTLSWLTKREGTRLTDVLNVQRERLAVIWCWPSAPSWP